MERLLDAGALDVYFTPVQMKKNRPGTLVTLLCRRPQLEELGRAAPARSPARSAAAITRRPASRPSARSSRSRPRSAPVRVKRARFDGRPLAAAPEFEDCRRIALASRSALARGLPRRRWRAATARNLRE